MSKSFSNNNDPTRYTNKNHPDGDLTNENYYSSQYIYVEEPVMSIRPHLYGIAKRSYCKCVDGNWFIVKNWRVVIPAAIFLTLLFVVGATLGSLAIAG
jgi:hypothetical protein